MVLPQPSVRMARVIQPVIPRVTRLLGLNPRALSLAQGVAAWGPPAAVREVLGQALALARTDPVAAAQLDRYGQGLGEPDLRQAVRTELEGVRQLDLDGSTVMVTAGSNMAFHAVAQVICDPLDEVILPLPWYFNHAMAIQLAGGVAVGVNAGFIPDPEALAAAITPRTRAIVTISPNNPSGVVLPAVVLEAINRLCARHGLFHISDEAYAEFVHGQVCHWSPGRAAGSGGHTISLYSLSKAYGMAGWRVGYAAVPSQLVESLAKVQDTNLICPPRLPQRAALAALEAGPAWCRPRIAQLGQRRRQLLDAVAAARRGGLDAGLVAPPDGAFYGLLECATPLGGLELMERLVRDHDVAVLPGESFGLVSTPGRQVLRISYGMLQEAELAEALHRLLNGLGRLASADSLA